VRKRAWARFFFWERAVVTAGKNGKPQRDNFYMTPRIINTLDLSLFAYRLYGQIKDVAGEDGHCSLGTRALAKACRISIGTVSKAKGALVKAGLIRIEKALRNGGYADTITVVDIWHENHAMYHQVKLPEPAVEQAPNDPQQEDPPSPEASGSRKTEVDAEFRAAMIERFGAQLSDVDERIEEALAHKSSKNWKDKQAGVRAWLRRDVEKAGGQAPGRSNGNRRPQSPHQRRIAAEKAMPLREAREV